MFVAVFSAIAVWSTTPSGPEYGNTIHLPTLRALTGRVAIYTGRQDDGVYHLSLIRPPVTELARIE